MAYVLADGWNYLRTGFKAGLDIDAFTPHLYDVKQKIPSLLTGFFLIIVSMIMISR